MVKKVVHFYKVPLILSATLSVVLIALRVERDVINIALLILGSLIGTFVLDLDFLIHAYLVAPDEKNSLLLADYLKHKDYKGFFRYIQTHKYDIEDKTLNSALFQLILGGVALFAVSSKTSLGIKALVISAFLNSIYRFFEYYLTGNLDQWFWSLKIRVNNRSIQMFVLILLAILVYSLYLL